MSALCKGFLLSLTKNLFSMFADSKSLNKCQRHKFLDCQVRHKKQMPVNTEENRNFAATVKNFFFAHSLPTGSY